MRNGKRLSMAILVVVPLVAAGWWLGSPLFLDRAVDEEFPFAAAAVVPDDMTRAQVEAEMATVADQVHEMNDPMPAPMVSVTVVKRGAFRDADAFHKGSGQATIYRLEDGSHVLRLEDFRVTNGPDLRVLLAVHPDPDSREALESEGYVELDKLKGNVGNQNYPIPDEVDVNAQMSVVIYCRPFHVLFAVAPLEVVQ